jgi:hypothetical protein
MARSYRLKYQRALGIYRLSPADGSHLVIFVLLFAVCRVYAVVDVTFEELVSSCIYFAGAFNVWT